jgi:uncharacterized protein YjeT (DUF2065 family)
MAFDQLISEARAKIIWGEPASDVRGYLVSNGMPEAEADTVIKEFSRERNAEIRRIGTKNVVIGAVLVGVSGILIYLIYINSSDRVVRVGTGKVIGVLACAGLYGLWKLVNGIIYLVRPQSEDKSITDLSD